MTQKILMQCFDEREHLTDHLRREITERVQEFISPDRFNLVVRVLAPRARTLLRQPRFMCEAVLTSPHLNRTIVVKKKSDNFYTAVNEVAMALRKTLRRASRRRLESRRAPQRFRSMAA